MIELNFPAIVTGAICAVLLASMGCSEHSAGSRSSDTSVLRKSDTSSIKASVDARKTTIAASDSDENPEPDAKTVLTDYYKDCKDTVRADTNVKCRGNALHISFLHYSTNDSLINLPYEYIKYWGLQRFVAHDFESHLRVSRGDSVVLDTIIRSNIFRSYADKNVAKYGTIFYSGLNFLPDRLRVDYSYSIALTDLGMAVHLEYLYSGKLVTKDEYH